MITREAQLTPGDRDNDLGAFTWLTSRMWDVAWEAVFNNLQSHLQIDLRTVLSRGIKKSFCDAVEQGSTC